MRAGTDSGMGIDQWFLSAEERGNPATGLDRRHPNAWSLGNEVDVLVHGESYFVALRAAADTLKAGDALYFTDWRGDPDEMIDATGTDISTVLAAAAARGARVNGLVWRSHWDRLAFSAAENRRLGKDIDAAGGHCLLDMRVRFGGSHHQKFVVIRHGSEGDVTDIAFVGGIDLCHGRRDDADHEGDPMRQPMAAVYGPRPPWHDAQAAIRGPAVGDIEHVFRERWTDPQPLSRAPWRRIADRVRGADVKATTLPAQPPDPPARGTVAIQVLRTYPKRLHPYPFAPRGERSVARGYTKAVRRARALIYIEDQYLWSTHVAQRFATALRDNPQLRLIAIVPLHPDQDGKISKPPNDIGRIDALRLLTGAAGDRVALYGIENAQSVPIYVHAKICVIDDVWSSTGSDNFNLRSWTHDSELSCAMIDERHDDREPLDPGGLGDGARVLARDLRLRLACEHLGRDDGDDADLLDPVALFDAMAASAARLDAWHASGGEGERPPGRLRGHLDVEVGRSARIFARPLYRFVYDPDGRPWGLRRKDSY